MSTGESNGRVAHDTEPRRSSAKVATSKHLKWTDIEDWRKDNHYLHTGKPFSFGSTLLMCLLTLLSAGYHLLTDSWKKAWLSLLREPHNETVNILSHLIGALIATAILVYTYKHITLPSWFGQHPHRIPKQGHQHFPLYIIYPFPSEQTPVTYGDTLAFSSFYLAAMACFGCSATFHTSTLHSEKMAKMYNKIDYLGIGALKFPERVPHEG